MRLLPPRGHVEEDIRRIEWRHDETDDRNRYREGHDG